MSASGCKLRRTRFESQSDRPFSAGGVSEDPSEGKPLSGEARVCGRVSASPILYSERGRPDALRPERRTSHKPSLTHLTGPE
jgi:hypothetical protein